MWEGASRGSEGLTVTFRWGGAGGRGADEVMSHQRAPHAGILDRAGQPLQSGRQVTFAHNHDGVRRPAHMPLASLLHIPIPRLSCAVSDVV